MSDLDSTVDPDLAESPKAMVRAARRARLIAHQTGTPLVIWENGKICLVEVTTADAERGRESSVRVKKP
ncbi:MAG: hypothetical protein H0W83_09600 [Planctomycetes bacterium]|nr:hypothetical protein [Planctomycetota bacterium]